MKHCRKTGLVAILLISLCLVYTKVVQGQNNSEYPASQEQIISKGVKTFVTRNKLTGNVISITHQGTFMGCVVSVGTDSLFNSNGELSSTITYINYVPKSSKGCHDLITRRKTLLYFPSGQVKSKQEHYYCYECEPKPCGTWESYNHKGQLLNSTFYGNTK